MKYPGYAGLAIDTEARFVPGGWVGMTLQEEDGNFVITRFERDYFAYNAGISPRDKIKEINGVVATTGL